MGDSEFPQQFSTDVKIEQSAKGARVTVHVFGNSQYQTMEDAILLYKQTIHKLKEEGLEVAPIEVKKGE